MSASDRIHAIISQLEVRIDLSSYETGRFGDGPATKPPHRRGLRGRSAQNPIQPQLNGTLLAWLPCRRRERQSYPAVEFLLSFAAQARIVARLDERASGPESGKRYADILEGRNQEGRVACESGDHQPFSINASECFQRPGSGIDEPDMRYAFAGIDIPFVSEVYLFRGWREDFADPIGGNCDECPIWIIGEFLLAPSGDIRNDDILFQMNFRLADDPPTARATDAVLEWRRDLPAQYRVRHDVRTYRSGMQMEISGYDLSDLVRRRIQNVIVAGLAARLLEFESGNRHGCDP